MTERSRQELKNPGYEIFVGTLSILSIFNIVLIYAVRDPNLDTVIDAMNWLLSIVFLADFTYRLGTGIIVVGVGTSAPSPAIWPTLFLAPSKTPDATPLPSTDSQAKVDQLRHLTTQQQNSIDELERLLRAE